jgi:hypothetical protein
VRLWFGIAGAALLSATCTRASEPPKRKAKIRVARANAGESNTRPADYVGPETCGECHSDEHDRWSQSLHRVMNAKADDAGAVIGNFGTTVPYDGGEVRFSHDGGYFMTFTRGAKTVRYRVTRTIGRRGLQEYVGIEDGHTEEVRLPFGWWPRYGGWAPQIAFDPWLEQLDVYAPVREPWAERCPWCHSTYPFDQRIARSATLGVGHGLEQLVAAAPQKAGRERLEVGQQVTTGISCESCHLGGRAHADGAAISFLPAGVTGFPRTFAEQRRTATIVNGVCAQCHSGPSPRLADGTALRNSSEALDLGASPCTGIKCTDCHDPHRADSRGDEARAIAACTHCHGALADAATAKAHGGKGHDGVTCLDCHMPKIVMGIDRFVRTHRISSPTNPTLLAEGAPNACNTCHLDQSTQWTLDALGMRLATKIDADAPLGEMWLASTSAQLRVFATWSYAQSPLAKYVDLKRGLTDPVPYVRAWTQLALKHSFTNPTNPR